MVAPKPRDAFRPRSLDLEMPETYRIHEPQELFTVAVATLITATLAAWLADPRVFGRMVKSSSILVPAAMSIGVVFVIRAIENRAWVREELAREEFTTLEGGLLVLQALLLAGLTGLLEARESGRPIDGLAFGHGARRHVFTFLFAGLALFLVHALATDPIGRIPALGILLLVPSLVVAPLLATASRHPKRPLVALREAAQLSLRTPNTCARPLVAVAAFLVAESAVLDRTLGVRAGEVEEYTANSILSFHSLPFAVFPMSDAIAAWTAVCAGFVSTVCLVSCRERAESQLLLERRTPG